MKEQKLELQWAFALANKCPLDKRKSKSIANYTNKAMGILPEKFTQLSYYTTLLFSYVRNKNNDHTREDCETYLAWKIWHSKLRDIDRFVVNPLCRGKAHLVARETLLEFHKSASRNSRNMKEIKTILNCSKDDYELFKRLDDLRALMEQQTAKAMEVYNNLVNANQLILGGIDQAIYEELKLLGDGKNA